MGEKIMSVRFPFAMPPVSVPEQGHDQPEFFAINLDLSIARDKAVIEKGGNLLLCTNASDGLAEVRIHFDETSGDGIPFRPGSIIQGIGFSKLIITNGAQPGASMDLLITSGDPTLNITSPQVGGPVVSEYKVDTLAYGVVTVDDTVTEIVSAKDRHTVSLRNVGSNPVYIGYDNGSLTTSNGYVLKVDEAFSFTFQGAISGICASGVTTDVAILDEIYQS
jgi:hypothetical protein